MLHIKYKDSECLCGHLHAIGLWTERVDQAKKLHERQIRSQEGVANEEFKPEPKPESDLAVYVQKVTCTACLVQLDNLIEQELASIARAGLLKIKQPPDEPEYRSIAAFIDFLREDERKTFSHDDVTTLRAYLSKPAHALINTLNTAGFALETRIVPKRIRGFSTSSHDRWYGPGSEKTHGGGSGF